MSDLPMRLRRNCHFDDCQEAADEIERLKKRNALLEDVAKAAKEFDKVLYGNSRKWAAVMGALDKLREGE